VKFPSGMSSLLLLLAVLAMPLLAMPLLLFLE
jgi:hypothetical protein